MAFVKPFPLIFVFGSSSCNFQIISHVRPHEAPQFCFLNGCPSSDRRLKCHAFVHKMISNFFQDTSEFNVATSSLHALSNSMAMSRTDKQSPHSSPRLARRSVTPNLCSVANLVQTNDIYASQMQQHHQTQSQTSIASSQSSNSNGSSAAGKAYNAARSSAGSTMQPVCFAQANLNRMSAPSMSTTSVVLSSSQQQQQQCVVNKALSKAQSAELNDVLHSNQDLAAPPLPPRKSSPIVDNVVNRMLKPSNAPTAPSHASVVSSTSTTSSENITTCELDVPQTEAPPIPKHNTVKSNHIDNVFEDDLKHIHLTSEDNGDKVIVGPAETISGIIDTRPIDARKPLGTTNMTVVTDKETILVTPNGANLYHLKVGGNGGQQQASSQDPIQSQHVQKHPSNQTRHQSFPGNSSSGQSTASGAHAAMPSKSQTTPHFGLEYVKLNTTTTPSSIASAATSSRSNANISHTNADESGTSLNCVRRDGPAPPPQQQPLLYENITINNKDCNVPYENINLEYIARLMNEGYSKENVITALGISRNNIEMACDILHEFVSKSSV